MSPFNLPNLLSLARLALVPFAVRAVLAGAYRQALGIFAVAAVTDALDGYLARRLHLQTRVGAYLDPLADKVLLSAVWVALALAGLAPWWLVGLIFGRDLLILAMAGGALLLTAYRDFPPSLWGKISTFFQIVAAVFVLVARAFPSWSLWPEPVLWAAAVATAWSGGGYLRRGVRMALACHRRSRAA